MTFSFWYDNWNISFHRGIIFLANLFLRIFRKKCSIQFFNFCFFFAGSLISKLIETVVVAVVVVDSVHDQLREWPSH